MYLPFPASAETPDRESPTGRRSDPCTGFARFRTILQPFRWLKVFMRQLLVIRSTKRSIGIESNGVCQNRRACSRCVLNSPGGSITAGMAIYDTMQYVRPDVVTTCVGQAASIAALLLAAGASQKRFSLPNSRILIHQPSMSGLSGQATDIDIHAKEILRMRSVINQLFADPLQPADRKNRQRHRARLHYDGSAGQGVRSDR